MLDLQYDLKLQNMFDWFKTVLETSILWEYMLYFYDNILNKNIIILTLIWICYYYGLEMMHLWNLEENNNESLSEISGLTSGPLVK